MVCLSAHLCARHTGIRVTRPCCACCCALGLQFLCCVVQSAPACLLTPLLPCLSLHRWVVPSGAGIIVSHDRWFLDRVCTHILAFEDGVVRHYEGNFSDYEEQKRMMDKSNAAAKKKKFKNIAIET